MAKNFFGGKDKGRFSGKKPVRDEQPQEQDFSTLEESLERDLKAILGEDSKPKAEQDFGFAFETDAASSDPEPPEPPAEDFGFGFDFESVMGAPEPEQTETEPARTEDSAETPEEPEPVRPTEPEQAEPDHPAEPNPEASEETPDPEEPFIDLDVADLIAQIDGDSYGMDYTDTQDLPDQMTGRSRRESPDVQPEQPHRKKTGKQKKQKQKKPALRIWTTIFSLILFVEAAYCVVIFTDWIKPIAALRSIYIDTAMITMRHQWLATWLIPGDIVMEVVERTEAHRESQAGVNSSWDDVDEVPKETKSPSSGFRKDAAATILSQIAQEVGLSSADDEFFELFHELDEGSVRDYASAHPEVIENGWENFYVHEAGLDDDGTDMVTTQGDQVLAIDAAHGLMVIRVTGSTYKGVLVFGKDPTRLKCAPSSRWGEAGEWTGTIAENNNGLVAMTGSGFGDNPDVMEGADQTGGAMCSGQVYGYHLGNYGDKRIELHKDNRLYVVDAYTDYSPDCTDATEWTPALIVDGVNVSGEDYTYTSLNPRTCLGQTRDETILMLGIEGRYWDSLGCNAVECASIMERYGAYQAMNVDGGTSSSLWYEGEYIIRCSNSNLLPEGRHLPNAWVYCDAPVAG